MITRLIIAAAVAFFFSPALTGFGQEHPEHPTKAKTDAKKGGQSAAPTTTDEKKVKAEISTGIRKHITSESKSASDKKFHVNYEGNDLALTLIKVHDDRLSGLGNDKYFACVDMKATDGKTYDIDFFLAGKPGAMNVTETSVHKIDGKPLYNWKEENGVWKKVSSS